MNKRQSFDDNMHIVLVNEAMGLCPLCGTPLMYDKNGRNYRGYEIAHIYPLNPNPEEVKLLASEELLNSDVNHRDNLVPLCESCHGKFDKPRTAAEYRELVGIKKNLMKQVIEREKWHKYDVEDEIHKVISHLAEIDLSATNCTLSYEPKTIDDKTDDTISNVTKSKIRFQVSSYFSTIKHELESIDSVNPGNSEVIALQIREYYIKQKQKKLSQQEIFVNMVNWLCSKCPAYPSDACEIIVSFFVQNCEVFS